MVLNYGRSDYGRATQTWKVCSGQDYSVFFANQDALFEYDFSEWIRHKLPRGQSVRSALVSKTDGRIYIGAINEFGYFELADNGQMRYLSLSDSHPDNEIRYAGNVWDVHKHGNTLYYRTEDRVIRFSDGEYEVLWPGNSIQYSCMVDETLHIATSKGLMVLMGSKFFPIHGSEPIAKHRIRGVISQGKNYMVFTADGGVYILDGFTAKPFPTEADDFMRQNEVYCIAYNKDKMAVGTVRGGLVVMDRDGKNPVYFSEHNGLQNNTVLSLGFDTEGNLWAGLDRGISCINMSLPFMELADVDESIGLGYTAARHGDLLYLGTNRGLYVQCKKHNRVHAVEGVKSQVWDLCQIRDNLYACTDNGIFLIKEDVATPVGDLSSAWTIQPITGHPDKVYAGTYTGLWVLDYNDGMLTRSHKVHGASDSFKKFQQDKEQAIWIINETQLERIELDARQQEVRFRHKYEVPTATSLSFLPRREPMSVLSSEGLFIYDEASEKFVPDTLFNSKYIGGKEYLAAEAGFCNYFLLSKSQIGLTDGGAQGPLEVFPFSTSLIEMIDGFERILPVGPRQAIVPTEKGFMLFAAPDSVKEHAGPPFHISMIFSTTGRDSVLYASNFMRKKGEVRIAPGYNSILVRMSQDSRVDGVQYQAKINDGDWDQLNAVPARQYVNMSPGKYMLQVKAVYPDGTEATDQLDLVVEAPWYRTIWAIVAYIVVLALLAWWLVRWDKRRTKAKEARAIQEKEQEMRQMEEQLEGEIARQEGEIARQEDEIVRQQEDIENLEKQRLEEELKHKSLEMANMMVNMTQKNEMLGDIKREIGKVIDQLKGNEARDARKQLQSLTSSIDDSINSQEVIDRIEEQFDVLHDNFMTRLTEKYPTLSVNERMMCGYLKMHLSTKEIAQLFNLSVRGVETVRYRLRKKLELSREQSLTEFIDSI